MTLTSNKAQKTRQTVFSPVYYSNTGRVFRKVPRSNSRSLQTLRFCTASYTSALGRLVFIHVATPETNPHPGTEKITDLEPEKQKVTNLIISVITTMTVFTLSIVQRQTRHASTLSCPPAESTTPVPIIFSHVHLF